MWERKVKQLVAKKIGAAIVKRAKQLVPVDTGALKQHIYFWMKGDKLIVGTRGYPYAEDMEYGKPPSKLNNVDKAEIKQWVKRHKVPENNVDRATKGVINSLETKGIKVGTVENPLHITSFGRDSYRPFLRPAIHQILTENRI